MAVTNNVDVVKKILKYTYGIVPIIAGFDKFSNLLVNWGKYANAQLLEIVPFERSTFMIIVGIIEIAAGILVFLKPRIGATIVMTWLIIIALTLVFSGNYIDVAVRDLVMAIGAFSLVKLLEKKPS